MSKLEVDAIEPQSGTTITIGSSGDTVNLVGTLNSNGSPLPGDISSVVAGTGLSGGGTTGAVTLNVEAAQSGITSLGTLTGLTVTGTGVVTTFKSTNNNTVLRLKGSNATNGGALGSTSSGDLTFLQNLAEGMRLNSTGLGIGTTSPDSVVNIEATKTTALSSEPDFLTLGLTVDDNTAYNTGVGGGIAFRGKRNSSGTQLVYGAIVGTKNSATNDGYNGNLRFFTNNNGNGVPTEHMRIDQAGKVSIGTTTSDGILKLDNTGQTSETLLTTEDTGGSGAHSHITLKNTTGTVASILTTSDNLEFRVDDATVFANISGTEHMRIKSSGLVGIGTSAPELPLSVVGLDTQIHFSEAADGGGYLMSEADSQFRISGGAGFKVGGSGWVAKATEAAIIGHDSGGDIKFFSNTSLTAGNVFTPTERMRIDSSGKVGIGTASPSSYYANHLVVDIGSTAQSGITIVADSSNQAMLAFADGTSGDTRFRGYLDYNHSNDSLAFASSGTERMRIDNSGNLLVGRSDNPSGVSNSLYATGIYAVTGAVSANVAVNSEGLLFRATSSLRYKNTIQNATHGLTELLNLRPVTYKGNNDGDKIFGGLIAEEVHEAGLTEFVEYDDEGNPDALHYSNMVSICIKAIQEQQTKIQELEARITTLENA